MCNAYTISDYNTSFCKGQQGSSRCCYVFYLKEGIATF